MTTLAPLPQDAVAPRGRIVRVEWSYQTPRPHEFEVVLCPEDEGGYSAFATRYPDVISQGDTVDEAKENIAEAFLAVLHSKRKHGEEMEYSHHSPPAPENAVRLWVTADG